MFAQAYQALRAGRAVCHLRNWSSISIAGADRHKYLNSFCSNDVKSLVPGECCEAFFLNVKGKTIGHGLLASHDNEIVFVGSPGQSPRLVDHLDRYIIREDVQLRDTTSELAWILAATTDTGAAPSFPWNLIGQASTRVFATTCNELPKLLASLAERGFPAVDDEVFATARIEAGMPLFGIDFDESNLPQEIGRDREAISFTKGCYLGQETVARIDALGHVNQRIVSVRFFGDEVPAPGAELSHSGNIVGRVTSSAFSPTWNAPLALAMIRREANTIGARLISPAGECEVVASVVAR